MVLRVEIIDKESDPTGHQYDDGADDLSDKGNRLLENVYDCENRQDQTDNVDDL